MPKIVDHEAYRQEVIQRATQLFVQQGYGGLGMRELAKALGISKSALYHYFPGKEALFRGVVEAVVKADIAALDEQFSIDATFEERLTAFIDHMLSNESQFGRDYLILTEYVRIREETENTGMLREVMEQYVYGIAAFLGITLEESTALYFQLTGVMIQRLFDNGHTDFYAAMAWILNSLCAKYSE